MVKRVAAARPVGEPWPLPDGWRWERLGSACEPSQYGWTTKAAHSGDIKFLRTTDISSGRVDWATVPYCSEAPSDLDRYRVKAGDILISRAGSVGKSFLIDSADDAVFASYLIRFRPLAVPRYIHYWLQTDFYWSLITENTAGIAIPNVNASKLSDLPVPMAPERVQEAIATRIDELFAEIDDGEAALARARDDLATWRKALLKAAVTGELTADWRAANPPTETGADLLGEILVDRRARWDAEAKNKGKRYPAPTEPDVGALPGLPAGWCWATMDQLSWASGYGTSEKCTTEPAGTPVLRIPNVRRGTIDLGDLKYTAAPLLLDEGRELSIGDLLIVRTNGSDDLIGRAALVLAPPPETTYFASYLIRLRLLGSTEVLHWIALLVDSPVFRASVLRSIASSAGQYNLSLSKIETFAVPIPPLDEIGAVISRLQSAHADAADGECSLRDASAIAATLRQSILAAAFRGELA